LKEGIQIMSQYLANPDVSCRIEGPDDGALLYNPDTDKALVINPVGLTIWQFLNQPRTNAEIVGHLQTEYEGVPLDQVAQDLAAFFQKLLPGGFIGEVLSK
jgi:hypothetical protein